jgi:hypothetical protein
LETFQLLQYFLESTLSKLFYLGDSLRRGFQKHSKQKSSLEMLLNFLSSQC